MSCHSERCLLVQQRRREKRRPPGRGSGGSLPFGAGDPGAKAATGDSESKWTRRTTSLVLVRRGVDATVAAAGGRGEGTLLAAMVVLLVK